MAQVDVSDDTWIRARPDVVAAAIHEDANWSAWWPDLAVSVDERRGAEGVRWTVDGAELAGTMEVWVEPSLDGALLHYFLRLDRRDGRPMARRAADKLCRRHSRRAKQVFWAVKDALEGAAVASRHGRPVDPIDHRAG